MSAPAGWHLQPDGQERYWDGAAWTDHFRAPLPSDPTAPPAPPAWATSVDETQALDVDNTQTIPAMAAPEQPTIRTDRIQAGADRVPAGGGTPRPATAHPAASRTPRRRARATPWPRAA